MPFPEPETGLQSLARLAADPTVCRSICALLRTTNPTLACIITFGYYVWVRSVNANRATSLSFRRRTRRRNLQRDNRRTHSRGAPHPGRTLYLNQFPCPAFKSSFRPAVCRRHHIGVTHSSRAVLSQIPPPRSASETRQGWKPKANSCSHITGGTEIPSTARVRISSLLTTATVASRNFFRPSSASVRMGCRW
jgi:hypothetical protein